MATGIRLVKMHGAGNDFILLDNRAGIIDDAPSLAISLCNRHFGVGADGLLVVSWADCADATMRIFNCDGSEAQMCGNGIRCVGKYLYDNGIVNKTTITVDTLAGIKTLLLRIDADNKVDSVTVDMGTPVVENAHLKIGIDDKSYDLCAVSTGNPHGVLFVNSFSEIDIPSIGPRLEAHPVWPHKANIEFAVINSPHSIDQRTWERGVGETLACGTGAIATAVAAVTRGLCSWPIDINLKGGRLVIDLDKSTGHILLTGPARTVFVTEF